MEVQEVMELSVEEAATLAGVSSRTIRNWIAAGDLEARNTPNGRKVRKADVVELLRKKGYAPPELETTVINLADARQEREQRVAHEPEETQAVNVNPTESPSSPNGNPTLSPELINVVLQPLVSQLNAAVERAERKERENLELAGRVGYLQAKVQQYEEQVKLLEAPKTPPEEPPEAPPLTQPPTAAPETTPEHKPWYKRLFALE